MIARRWAPSIFLLTVALAVGCSADDSVAQLPSAPSQQADEPNARVKAGFGIFFPDGVRHSIPLAEIAAGGPPIDGIPALTEPTMVRAGQADYLNDNDIVLGIEVNGDARAYPLRIMNWHEIVNDTIGGEPVAVTYCPLCGTGIAFDARVNGEKKEFGVSGLLHNSDLLMYDRHTKTPSLWQQALGRAVVGPLTDTKLKILPMAHTRWDEWVEKHPQTTVVDDDTGFARNYGLDPYQGYADDERLFFQVTGAKNDLPRKEWVFGVIAGGQPRAYPIERIGRNNIVNDEIAGEKVVVLTGGGDPPSARAYLRGDHTFQYVDGALADENEQAWEVTEEALIAANGETLERIGDGFVAFWFAWSAFYPQTDLYEEGLSTGPDADLKLERWGEIKKEAEAEDGD